MPIRIILQRIKSAKLLLNGKSFKDENKDNEQEEDKWMECGEGVIIYIAFFKDTKNDEINSLIHKIFTNPLFRTLKKSLKKHEMEVNNDEILETNIMIVPQFSLGGKIKSGKNGAQYHSCANPNNAKKMYQTFSQNLIDKVNQIKSQKNSKNLNVNCHFGVFGNRQGMFIETHGPFTHCFDIIDKSNNENNKIKKTEIAMSNKIDSIINLIKKL